MNKACRSSLRAFALRAYERRALALRALALRTCRPVSADAPHRWHHHGAAHTHQRCSTACARKLAPGRLGDDAACDSTRGMSLQGSPRGDRVVASFDIVRVSRHRFTPQSHQGLHERSSHLQLRRPGRRQHAPLPPANRTAASPWSRTCADAAGVADALVQGAWQDVWRRPSIVARRLHASRKGTVANVPRIRSKRGRG